ncbi:MAG: hypothetical protein KF901_33800, partial [Myxococcales bacterium]|nr:hypothetical protein [Myxococcales bacterium]
MTVHDVTRHLFQPGKQYSGARMQQGRVLLDADFNEHATLMAEDHREGLVDLIGPVGSSDEGFSLDLRVGEVVPTRALRFGEGPEVSVLDVGLRPGSLYLGGQRLTLAERELAWAQRDFLSMREGDAPLADSGRFFAWIETREQVVSAHEDGEIVETALGGPDTTTRVRRLRRVRFAALPEGAELGCEAAREAIEHALGGTLDPRSHEVRSSARLQISFEGDASDDACAPCTPSASGRYLGAENQTIRVMLTGPSSYVWGFDAAAPLYRVEVDGDALRLITPPRDEHHAPRVGAVVELLGRGALLENGELTADVRGVLTRVSSPLSEGRFSIEDPAALDALVRAWPDAHPDASRLGGGTFFARFWHRDEGEGVEIPTGAGHALGQTGIVPTFSGEGRAGDQWLLSVRPADPEQVVPWSLLREPTPPSGERVWAAPLGAFEVDEEGRVTALVDCRPRFRPLTEQRGCCTVTVGDGVRSVGDFRSIQAAIDALPAEGGRVCVRPGTYREEVAIVGRVNVVVEGCGLQTRVESPEAPERGAVFAIDGSTLVSVRDLWIQARGQVGVRVGQEGRPKGTPASRRVSVRGVFFELGPEGDRETRSAVEAHGALELEVRECEVIMDGSPSAHAGIFVSGEELVVERCRVHVTAVRVPEDLRARTFGASTASFAWGGVQIGGDSARVRVRECRIDGGLGHGVTLGSVVWQARQDPTRWRWLGGGFGFFDPRDPCPVMRPAPGRWVAIPGDEERFPVSAGDLEDVEVVGNHVEAMATNGVSVIASVLWRPTRDSSGAGSAQPELIAIRGLRVVDNVITRNVRRPSDGLESGAVIGAPVPVLVHGGIVLGQVEDASVEGNRIERNGPSYREPVCGMHVVMADALRVERNTIRDNGGRLGDGVVDRATRSGRRGGVVVELAGLGRLGASHDATLRVRGNVVEQPAGPALYALAAGPVAVQDNHLASGGSADASWPALFGHALTVIDLGGPFEPRVALGAPAFSGGSGRGGQLLVQGNQVILGWVERPTALRVGVGVTLWSADDVRVVGNQFAASVRAGNGEPMHAHVFVVGTTLHASGNRFAEGSGDTPLSFYGAAAWACTVVHNEATHCVLSICESARHVAGPNLELDDAACAALRRGLAATPGASAPV